MGSKLGKKVKLGPNRECRTNRVLFGKVSGIRSIDLLFQIRPNMTCFPSLDPISPTFPVWIQLPLHSQFRSKFALFPNLDPI